MEQNILSKRPEVMGVLQRRQVLVGLEVAVVDMSEGYRGIDCPENDTDTDQYLGE